MVSENLSVYASLKMTAERKHFLKKVEDIGPVSYLACKELRGHAPFSQQVKS